MLIKHITLVCVVQNKHGLNLSVFTYVWVNEAASFHKSVYMKTTMLAN